MSNQFELFKDEAEEPKILLAGVDEVGRGPLAGPVVAAAVILDEKDPIDGLADSKKLTAGKRRILKKCIEERSVAWSVGWATVDEIDEINILQASLLAMQRAVESLSVQPTKALIDGNKCPKLSVPAEAIVQGDSKVAAISAASIIAKVIRDDEMCRLDLEYPGYGFAGHKGYPTASHLAALKELGVTEIHRRSYRPVRLLLDGQ